MTSNDLINLAANNPISDAIALIVIAIVLKWVFLITWGIVASIIFRKPHSGEKFGVLENSLLFLVAILFAGAFAYLFLKITA